MTQGIPRLQLEKVRSIRCARVPVYATIRNNFSASEGSLPHPVLRETRAEFATARERVGVRVISSTRCSGDLEHQVLAMPAHRVHQITLTLPSPGVPGEGTGPAHARVP